MIVPVSRVRALNPTQNLDFPNSHGRSPWSGGGWRVVNHTKRCHGPHLIIFKDLPPSDVEWAPIPLHWIGIDSHGVQAIRFVSRNGTLCPEPWATPHRALPVAAPTVIHLSSPCIRLGSAGGQLTDSLSLPFGSGAAGSNKRPRGTDSGSSTSDCDAAPMPGDPSPLSSDESSIDASYVSSYSSSATAAVMPNLASHPILTRTADVPPETAPPPVSEPPSVHALWEAFGHLHRAVRARLIYDAQRPQQHDCKSAGLPPSEQPSLAVGHHPPRAVPVPVHALHPAGGHGLCPRLGAPPPPSQPQLQTLATLLSAFEVTAAGLMPSLGQPPTAHAVPPSSVPLPTPPHAPSPYPSQPPVPGAQQAATMTARLSARPEQPCAGALSEATAESYEREIAMWLDYVPEFPSPPTSPPDIKNALADDPSARRRGVAASTAAAIASFLVLWWRELKSPHTLPTTVAVDPSAKPPHGDVACADGSRPHSTVLLAACRELFSWGRDAFPSRGLLSATLILAMSSGILVQYIAQSSPDADTDVKYLSGAFAIYLILSCIGQRFVLIYTASVWFDGLAQLATCFLPHQAKLEIVQTSLRPEVLAEIRAVCVASAVCLAFLPRSTRWKLSLYTSRQLLLFGVQVQHAISVSSLHPLVSFATDACAPFLLTFGAVELVQRAVRSGSINTTRG